MSIRPLFVAALCCATAVSACSRPPLPASSPSRLLGAPAPEISRDAVSGQRVDLAAMRGSVVVVKFFAKYCEPCKKTLPAVEAVHKKRDDVRFVGVAEDEYERDARQIVADYGLTFPVVHDASNAIATRFGVRELPVTFVVDATGAVRWVGGPEKSELELVNAIEASR